MTESVYERVLGADIQLIRPELRGYFSAGDDIGVGQGTLEVAGSRYRWLRPILWFLAHQRILFPEYATDIPFRIVNIPTPDGGLRATRTFQFPQRERPLEDTMRVVDGALHDFMGKKQGFEIQMILAVSDGWPRMRSGKQWLHIGSARIRVPRLASVHLTEGMHDDNRTIDVRLHSPLIGEWFRYTGTFSYRTKRGS